MILYLIITVLFQKIYHKLELRRENEKPNSFTKIIAKILALAILNFGNLLLLYTDIISFINYIFLSDYIIRALYHIIVI